MGSDFAFVILAEAEQRRLEEDYAAHPGTWEVRGKRYGAPFVLAGMESRGEAEDLLDSIQNDDGGQWSELEVRFVHRD